MIKESKTKIINTPKYIFINKIKFKLTYKYHINIFPLIILHLSAISMYYFIKYLSFNKLVISVFHLSSIT